MKPALGADGFGPCRALGVVRGDRLLGGIVFHNFKGATIEMSGAFDRADWIPDAAEEFRRWASGDPGTFFGRSTCADSTF